jgi:hypothetical protein
VHAIYAGFEICFMTDEKFVDGKESRRKRMELKEI